MNEFHFSPEEQQRRVEIPDFEDARADNTPYYASNKSTTKAKSEVLHELAKLGAGGTRFVRGHFGEDPKRYGYAIRFHYGGREGLIRVAGLPIGKTHTEHKVHQVRLQALLNVRDWLKAMVTQQVFTPGSEPLIQFLLVDGQRTVTDAIVESGHLPRLNPAGDEPPLLEGEIVQ